MSTRVGSVSALPRACLELAAYGAATAALASSVWLLGLPQPLFSFSAIPIAWFAMRWPRWALAVALLLVLILGSALSLLVAESPGAEIRRVVIQVIALGAIAELISRVVRSRSLALAALAGGEARHRRLVESLNVIPWELELATQRFVYVGPQAERLLGHPLAAWRDMAWWEATIHPEDRAAAVRFCADAVERGADHEFEYRMIAADGRAIWIRDIVTVIREDDGPGRLRGVMIDQTEKQHAAEERSRLERRLLEGQRLQSLGMLAGGIAHDFNNFLTPILGNLSGVLESESLSDGAQERLRDAEAAAQCAADVAQQMLTYSGGARFLVRDEDLSRVVGETARLLAAGLSRRASVKLDLSVQPIWVRAEASQLRQLVMNVLTNAVDAVEKAGGNVLVRTAMAESELGLPVDLPGEEPIPAGPSALLEVRDDGEGMDEEVRRHLFDPFFTTKAAGHGLGMATVLGIVRAHGGAIDIESAPGVGTLVRVRLPLVEAPESPREAEVSALPAASCAAARVVLVVDDEAGVRRVVRAALESSGCRVIEAADGEQAIEMLARAPADIAAVLLDMTMPRLSGAETLRRMRELAPGLPVLLMSGYSEQAFSDTSAGSTAFLHKPFRAAELRLRLAELLASAGPTREAIG